MAQTKTQGQLLMTLGTRDVQLAITWGLTVLALATWRSQTGSNLSIESKIDY